MARAYPHRVRQALEFANAVALAGVAIHGMVVEYELNDIAARGAYLLGVGVHLHPVGDRIRAGRDVITHSLDLHDADPARPLDRELRVVTEARDAETQGIRGLHDGLAVFDGIRLSVYVYGDHLGHGSESSFLFLTF